MKYDIESGLLHISLSPSSSFFLVSCLLIVKHFQRRSVAKLLIYFVHTELEWEKVRAFELNGISVCHLLALSILNK